MSKTIIKECSCMHEFQDKLYGKRKRVHNALKKGSGGQQKYRCTVCHSVKGGPEVKEVSEAQGKNI